MYHLERADALGELLLATIFRSYPGKIHCNSHVTIIITIVVAVQGEKDSKKEKEKSKLEIERRTNQLKCTSKYNVPSVNSSKEFSNNSLPIHSIALTRAAAVVCNATSTHSNHAAPVLVLRLCPYYSARP